MHSRPLVDGGVLSGGWRWGKTELDLSPVCIVSQSGRNHIYSGWDGSCRLYMYLGTIYHIPTYKIKSNPIRIKGHACNCCFMNFSGLWRRRMYVCTVLEQQSSAPWAREHNAWTPSLVAMNSMPCPRNRQSWVTSQKKHVVASDHGCCRVQID